MSNAAPIIYSFFGVGSGTLGTDQFDNEAFVITILTNTDSIVTNANMYPVPVLQNLCSQATATIAIAGLPSSIIGFGLTITALNNPQANLYQVSVGLAPDALVGVTAPALKGYGLDKSIGPVFGSGAFSQKPYPTTAGNLLFSSFSSTAFLAALAVPGPTPLRPAPGNR